MLDGFRCVVSRELLTSSRRRWTQQSRAAVVLVLGAALFVGIGLVLLRWSPTLATPEDWADLEIPRQVVRAAAAAGFAAMLAASAGVALGFAPRELSASVAGEREKSTLDGLLGTRLGAAEIVGGKLCAGLFRTFAALGAGLPLLVLVAMFGGADLRLMALSLGGVAATVFLLSALAVALSVLNPTPQKAQVHATLLAVAWIDIPFVLVILGPRLFPVAYAPLRPAAELALASSPIAILAHLIGLSPGPSLAAVIGRMIALELSAGLALVALATAALRPSSRRLAGGPARGGAKRRALPGRRPPCGDDPMEWKERQAARVGRGAWVLGLLAYGAMFTVLAYVSSQLAWSAWQEVTVKGYGSAAASDERWTFNQTFIRPLSGAVVFALMAVAAGTTAESLDLERKRGTWLVLLSTPLTPKEILGAKRRASLRRTRPFAAAVTGAWLLGAAVGAIHPVGLLATLAGLASSLRFSTSLGAYSAVRAAGERPGTNLALLFLVFGLLLAPLPILLTGRPELLPLGVVSPPLASIFSLLTWDEVRSAAGVGTAGFGGVVVLRVPPGPTGGGWLLLNALLTTPILLAASAWLDRRVERIWDASVGRPVRDAPRGLASGGGRPAS